MKHVKMFGKSVPLIAIVLAGILTLGASALLVNYLSDPITTPVTMSSPIDLSATLTYWPVAKGFFTTASGGVAGWSNEQSMSIGDYSAKLSVALPADEARLVFSYDGLLKDIAVTGITYNSYVQGLGGGVHPFVVLGLDSVGDGFQDSCVIQWENADVDPSGENTWISTTFGADSIVHVAQNRYGLPEDQYVAYSHTGQDADTLTALIAEPFDSIRTWGDLRVIQVKVMIGELTGIDELLVAYVDDISGAVDSNCDPVEQPFVGGATALPIMSADTIFASGTVVNRANNPVDFVTAIVIREADGKAWTPDDGTGVKELEAFYWYNGWESLDSTTLIVDEHLVILVGGDLTTYSTLSPGASSTTDHKFVTSSQIHPSTYTVKVVVVAPGTLLADIPRLAGFGT